MTDFSYAHPATLPGMLQRGLGRGLFRAGRADDGREAALACLAQDRRWCVLVDERAVYLARLVRRLNLPVLSLVTMLRDDDAFDTVRDVLGGLGLDGDPDAIDGLRRYVEDGPRWSEALEHIARHWPREWWDDLLPVARGRLAVAGDEPFLHAAPWADWAATDDLIAAARAARPVKPVHRPLAGETTDRLVTIVGASSGGTAEIDRRRTALRESS